MVISENTFKNCLWCCFCSLTIQN